MYYITIGAASVSFRHSGVNDIRYVPPCEITTVGSRRNNLFVHAGNEILRFNADRGIVFNNGATTATYDSAKGVANNWIFADCAGGAAPPGGGQEHFEPFVNQTVVVVNHGFGEQYPNVEVVDDGGDEITAHIEYTDVNNLTVTMNPAATGTVICRDVT